MMCVPTSVSSVGERLLTDPWVATGIKAGVGTVPCPVCIIPSLALPSDCVTLNSNLVELIEMFSFPIL